MRGDKIDVICFTFLTLTKPVSVTVPRCVVLLACLYHQSRSSRLIKWSRFWDCHRPYYGHSDTPSDTSVGKCTTTRHFIEYFQGRQAAVQVRPKHLHRQNENTVELHLYGLIGTASHLDMQKIRIILFFFENMPHWQSEVRMLLFTAFTCV